jgi:hypothetical protein
VRTALSIDNVNSQQSSPSMNRTKTSGPSTSLCSTAGVSRVSVSKVTEVLGDCKAASLQTRTRGDFQQKFE